MRVRYEKVFGLRAVDRVAEATAAKRFVSAAVPALRELPGQTRAALAAGRDGSDKHALADLIPGNAWAQFFNNAHRLVTDDEAGFDRVLAAHDVQVRAADGRQRDADHSPAHAYAGSRAPDSTRLGRET